MEIVHVYTRLRGELGRQCVLSDRRAEPLIDVPPQPDLSTHFIRRPSREQGLQAARDTTEHQVNTERFESDSKGMDHSEGGWPKDINPQEAEQTIRYRKKVEKDEGYVTSILQLGSVMEHCIRQNHALDIYEEYFDEEEEEEDQEPPSAKTINVFRYDIIINLALSFHPDGGRKLVAAYSFLGFQRRLGDPSLDSYIWDMEKPNCPDVTLKPPSPLLCIHYNPKDPHTLLGGTASGQIAYWDTRRGSRPVELSSLDQSHRDPAHNVLWTQSKGGTDAFSASTDGQVLWWDIRRLSCPVDRLVLDMSREENLDRALGAVSLEFESTMPTKFLVGTEQGVVVSCNRKAKSNAEKMVCTYEGHHGPVQAVTRNPFFTKNFLTVGDWSARIWSEDVRESSIIWTRNQSSYLMDACWSPVRPSVFFCVKTDGVLDVWDVLFKHNEPTLSVKVSDWPLYSVCVQEASGVIAVGSQHGDVSLMELSDKLKNQQKNEKTLLSAMFERETKRERLLEARLKEVRLKERSRSQQSPEEELRGERGEEEPLELLDRAERDFNQLTEHHVIA
uniref:Dynein, axonemal, intermediate chain 2b n=1 Tax=Gouania willdenowi TaxID=441366 RepID=A0A8C5DDE6_GOUWI